MIVKRMCLGLYLFALALTANAGDLPADAGLAEVSGLGSSNGEALACSYRELAARIKQLVIQRSPVARRYGEAFEIATNEAFLGRIKSGPETCPDMAALNRRVDELALRLQTAVSPENRQQVEEEGQPEIGIVPRYLLMDTKGRAVTQQDFPGKFQLISFGYTFCPDICPTTLAEMTLIMNKLGKQAERLQPIFVTVDPARDTPKKLGQYTEFFHPRIIGLTGSPELVRRVADNFKVRYEKHLEPGAAADKYSMDHSAGMYLLGPDGRFLVKFAYGTPPKDAAEQIGTLMGQEPSR